MEVVLITGQLGTGKSTVASMLQSKGAAVVSFDELREKSCKPGSSTFKKIVNTFGEDSIGKDGKLNFHVIDDKCYQNENLQKAFTQITYHSIQKRLLTTFIIEYFKGTNILVIDAPEVVDDWLKKFITTVVVVFTDPPVQKQRIHERDDLQPEDIANRISSQMTNTEKGPMADFKIDNSGSTEKTERQVNELYFRLKGVAGKAVPVWMRWVLLIVIVIVIIFVIYKSITLSIPALRWFFRKEK